MKFDSSVRTAIVAALDQLGPIENDPNVQTAIRALLHVIVNEEDWRPERWSIRDY